jgi:hypothetical protein
MKDRYFGDIDDYRKVGLLRALQSTGDGGLLVAQERHAAPLQRPQLPLQARGCQPDCALMGRTCRFKAVRVGVQ